MNLGENCQLSILMNLEEILKIIPKILGILNLEEILNLGENCQFLKF
jgi:hypothetical protein